MASITKLGACWQAQVRRQGHPRRAHTFDTKHEAEPWARMVEQGLGSGTFVMPDESDHTTLADALER